MHSKAPIIHRWIVLYPHQDSLGPIFELRNQLWQSGCRGAKLFPPFALIAPVAKPASAEVLQTMARLLRGKSLEDSAGGFITGEIIVLKTLPNNLKLLGIPLSISIQPEKAGLPAQTNGVTNCLSVPEKPLMPIGIIENQRDHELARSIYQRLPPLHFRQGAVANFAFILTVDGSSATAIRWELGKPYWMARHG